MNRRAFLALASSAATLGRGETVPDKPLLSFGLLTDVQYADAGPKGERHYRASLPKLRAAAADLASLALPFSLHLGDVVDRDFASFGIILPVFDVLGHPVHHLLGNHDFSVEEAEKPRVANVLGMPADYYSFTRSGVRFVMLDTNDLSIYKHARGSAGMRDAEAYLESLEKGGANNAKPWNGGVSPAQLAWLDKELAEADAAGQPAIVCGHHPILSEQGHQAWNNREILDTLERHPAVRAYLCGHQHDGGQVIHRGIPFLTFKSVLQEPNTTAYAVLRLFPDHLAIDGRGREASRVLRLR